MFHAPIYLLLLLAIPLLAWRMWAAGQMQAISFSTTQFSEFVRPTWRQKLVWIPPVLSLLAIALLIVCLAGPREGNEKTTTSSEGIAIQILVDRSGSMRALDFKKQDQPVDRLTAIKDVAGRFILGDDQLDGRFNDLVGLVTFAGMATAQTPPTLDHTFVVSQLHSAEIVTRRDEDGTAIGDAIGLAVEKLSTMDESQKKQIKSKIAILLTDGENTAGDLEPLQAADLAKMMDIKVYTIGVGTKGRAPIPVRDPFTGRQRILWDDVNIDEATLQQIAEKTGGKYFRATDTKSLEAIYSEIDRLEKTEVESIQYVDYRELAVQTMRFGSTKVPPLAWWAMMFVSASVLLKNTVFREF